MKQLIILIVSLFYLVPSLSANRFDELDIYAIKTPQEYTYSVRDLANYLIRPTNSDLEIYRCFAVWIVFNIQYDIEGVIANTIDYNEVILADVLRNRKTVCGGYSKLLDALLKEVGIETEIVFGYARSYPQMAGIPLKEVNHAWNVINLDGAWQLSDITWADTDGRGINEDFFLPNPEVFMMSHFPEDTKWLLVENPITKDIFDGLPYYHSSFFRFNIVDHPQSGLLKSNSGTYKLKFKHNSAKSFRVEARLLGDESGKYTTMPFHKKSTSTETILNLKTAKKGAYNVRISAYSRGRHVWLMHYTLLHQ